MNLSSPEIGIQLLKAGSDVIYNIVTDPDIKKPILNLSGGLDVTDSMAHVFQCLREGISFQVREYIGSKEELRERYESTIDLSLGDILPFNKESFEEFCEGKMTGNPVYKAAYTYRVKMMEVLNTLVPAEKL